MEASPVSAVSYLARAKELLKSDEEANLIYAALELRCGVEARLKEHAAVAIGVTKTQLGHYEIRKLSKTVHEAFGLGDTFLLVFLQLDDGRVGQFTYAPVTTQLQDIASRLGDYLHAVPHERVVAKGFWTELRSMLTEACGLLDLACSSEVLRPAFEHGLHICLPPGDPRTKIVTDYNAGVQGTFKTFTIEPIGRMTYYPGDEA
jgi:hypothetical protein